LNLSWTRVHSRPLPGRCAEANRQLLNAFNAWKPASASAFSESGRDKRLTEDGVLLLDYARRIPLAQ
jgi:hypothetical protein